MYQNRVGGSVNLPPFWALGWHQASEKYQTQDAVVQMLQNYSSKAIPLDAVYLDFSYLNAD